MSQSTLVSRRQFLKLAGAAGVGAGLAAACQPKPAPPPTAPTEMPGMEATAAGGGDMDA